MLASSLKTGTIFKEGGNPFVVEKYEHTKTARGGATIKIKARNLLSGQISEKRYQSSAKVEDADVFRKNVQYLYKDDGKYIFMDPKTYEQLPIKIGKESKFLAEGASVLALYFEGKPMLIELPNTLIFKVINTTPGYKGNTVSNVMKDATIDTGAQIKVPTFIKVGDKIKINTKSGEYVSKA
ncbi:elongation factor P [Patescibacteria group bacterium]